jgi:hypothetical protein
MVIFIVALRAAMVIVTIEYILCDDLVTDGAERHVLCFTLGDAPGGLNEGTEFASLGGNAVGGLRMAA